MADKILLWLSILSGVAAQASVTVPNGVVGTAPPLPFLAGPQPVCRQLVAMSTR